jgi:hypothetical protein
MARNSARRHQERIETDITNRFIWICREPYFGGSGNSSTLPLMNGFRSLIKAGARFYFSEDQKVTPSRDNVDFAERASPTPRQNAKSLCDQESGSTAFGRDTHPKS